MKRILSIIIVLLLCVSAFAGCEKPDAETLIAKHENDCENIDQKLASEIKIAYSQYTNDVNYGGEQRFTPEDIFILRYEGEIGGCHFVMLGGDEIDYTTAFRSVEVAGYVVEFSSGQPMYAYKDGNFYTLKQAYENSNLADSDVYEIGLKVDPSFAERYASSQTVTNATGTRIYDAYHPDDSERYPYFSVTLSALNNATVEHKEDSKIYVDGEYLLGGSGNGCNSFYLSDLTGDGVPELCFGMNFGSGIVDQRIEIVDYATKETLFSLSGRGTNDYYLFLRNGVLCIKETEYMKNDAVRTGVLTYNGSEISVAWDSEVNATVDGDNSPAPGEPVS